MPTGICTAWRWTTRALLLSLVLPALASAQTFTRKATLAGLDRLMAGEVLHADYGEGALLQQAVNAAFERGDLPIIRLAHRAWRPIVPFASRPVGTVAEPPDVSIESRSVLNIPRAARYTAEIFCSIDDGPLLLVGTIASEERGTATVPMTTAPREPGFHHLRFQARITYSGADVDLPPETRRLADVSYAIYDPIQGIRADLAQFEIGPRLMSADQLDPKLPGIPFIEWLRGLPGGAGAGATDGLWRSVRCPRGPRQLERPSNYGDVCTLGYLPFGALWIRTGRIERHRDGARLVAEAPRVLAIQLHAETATEVYSLFELADILAVEPDQWPGTSISLAPEDIVVTRTGAGNAATLDVTVTIRNEGAVDARDLLVTMLTSNGNELYMFHVDVPRRASAQVKWSEKMPWPYGAVIVSVETTARAGAYAVRRDQSHPDSARAFRIVNPRLAPEGYLNWIRDKHATPRGY